MKLQGNSLLSRRWPLMLVVLLAACSSTRAPAPIQSRTGEPPRPAEPRRELPALTPPAPAPAPASSGVVGEGGGVQTAPVRSSGIESRPLEARPLGPPAAGTAATAPPATGTATTNTLGGLRTAPKVLKRPYSDVVLAEVKAAENAPARPGETVRPAEPAKGAEPAKAGDSAKAGDAGKGVDQAKGADQAKAGDTAKAADPAKAADAAKASDGAKGADPGKAADTSKVAAIDLAWPSRGKVVQGFSEPKSMGVILEGKVGDPVGAAADGKVIFSGPGPRGYGNLIIVKHDADTVTVYAHNKALLVKEGQSVKRGQKIAEVGDTGNDKAGLHFEVRRQGKPVDPQKILPKR